MDRRLVWAACAAGSALLYVSCAPCWSSSDRAEAQPPAPTLVDGGVGDPCEESTQCTTGLYCADVFPSTEADAAPATFRACTRDCAADPCPSGSLCADAPVSAAGADGGLRRLCVPSCSSDVDCRLGKRAGTCVGDAGTAVDGGAPGGRCQPIVCGTLASSYAGCPADYTCQESYAYSGGTRRNEMCLFGSSGSSGSSGAAAPRPPPPPAWCGK